ncbi:hypothetical protein B0H14DRAFT_2724771 [Mycena olivaceomarginata]|nr:hypothetical protein B0H14DRAFT_2724771 [Mycena olivaceomarginata]
MSQQVSMFNECRNVTIHGGNFTVVGNAGRMSLEEDYRSIRLGDLNLVSHTGTENIVRSRHSPLQQLARRTRVIIGTRKMYRARVFGSLDTFTAIVYEGQGAAQQMSEALELNVSRHPNFMQLFGVVHSSHMNALVYHDDILPLSHTLVECQRVSPLHAAYFLYQMSRDLACALRYWMEFTDSWLFGYSASPFTESIRVSTGQLCLDVGHYSGNSSVASNSRVPKWAKALPVRASIQSALLPELLNSLAPEDIHLLVAYLKKPVKIISLHHGTVYLGSLHWSPERRDPYSPLAEILYFPTQFTHSDLRLGQWEHVDGASVWRPAIDRYTADGWAGIHIAPFMNERTVVHFQWRVRFNDCPPDEPWKWWLAQANCVFSDGELSDEYFIPTGISFTVSVWDPQDSFLPRRTSLRSKLVDGIYLFLFPPQIELRDGRVSVQVPRTREAYYWAFDHDGEKHLSELDTEEFGVPEVLLETSLAVNSWSLEEYNLLREVYIAKGFDPETSELSQNLGYPLPVVHQQPVKVPLDADTVAVNIHGFPRHGICVLW